MKKCLVFILSLLFLIPRPVYSNGAGLPPFFKVNGKVSAPNPLQNLGITASTFLIPQDFAPKNYEAGVPIDFEVDTPILESFVVGNTVSKIDYKWDFGDGSPVATGTKNTHVYTNIGSYILVLTINISMQGAPSPTQFIDSYFMNVVPDTNYRNLPQAIIKVNNQVISNSPFNSALPINFNIPVRFDASTSQAPSSQIVEYLWNFGDGQTGTGPTVTHQYQATQRDYAVVVLRVKDKNGFISDAFTGLSHNSFVVNNTSNSQNTPIPTTGQANSNSGNGFDSLSLAVLTVAILLLVGFYISKRRNSLP